MKEEAGRGKASECKALENQNYILPKFILTEQVNFGIIYLYVFCGYKV